MMNNKYALLFAIVVFVIFVDQWSKQLAVHYLRSPDDSDFRKEHYQKCTSGFDRCKKLCRKKSLHASGSVLSCNRTCERNKMLCRRRLDPSYKKSQIAWLDQLETLKSSSMCRRIIQRSPSHPECVVVENYWHFTYRTNSGAAWGIFSTVNERIRRPFFISITIIAILFIFYLFAFRLEVEHRLMIIALALILGGALGNFLDRLRLNYVIDFIEWFWRSRHAYTWPTFNIADAAISIGVVLIGIELLFFAPPEEFYQEEDETNVPTENQKESIESDSLDLSDAEASTDPETVTTPNADIAPVDSTSTNVVLTDSTSADLVPAVSTSSDPVEPSSSVETESTEKSASEELSGASGVVSIQSENDANEVLDVSESDEDT